MLALPENAVDEPVGFSSSRCKSGSEAFTDSLSQRDWFYGLLHADHYPALVQAADTQIAGIMDGSQCDIAPDSDLDLAYLQRICKGLHKRIAQAQETLREAVARHNGLAKVLRQLAPYALTEACHLQGLPTDLIGENALAFWLHEELLQVLGLRTGEGSSRENYRHQMQQMGLESCNQTSERFSYDPEIIENAFTLPAFLLCLAQCSRTRLPEILGAHITYQLAGSTTDWLCELNTLPAQTVTSCHFAQRARFDQPLDELAKSLTPKDLYRVYKTMLFTGHAYLALLKTASDARAVNGPGLHKKVGHIFVSKMPGARGFHHQVMLGDRTLEDWFSRNPFPTERFLSALADSQYVDKNTPVRSAILQAMRFGGPMFGVFSELEQSLIQQWVKDLPHAAIDRTQETQKTTSQLRPKIQQLPSLALSNTSLETQFRHLTPQRCLFHSLLNKQQYPGCQPKARRCLQSQIGLAQTRMKYSWFLPKLMRGFVYTPSGFRQRLDAIFARQTDKRQAYPPAPLLTRDRCRWLVQQIAPAALVDGCWLQGAVDSGSFSKPITSRLTRIYRDELGTGFIEQNHTRLYRDLLSNMGIDMPPVHTEDFIRQQGLLDAGFEVPVLFLCISLFYKEYFPELLGINLGFELSGLGKDYQAMIDELRYWQADPYFFMLHQSIDNHACGHAALAAEAIALYLEEAETAGGSQSVQAQWSRVWCGYVIFHLTLQRFFRAVLLHLLPGLSTQWFRRSIAAHA